MFSIKNLKIIAEFALTLSLCTILNCITLFKMPFGGSVTLGHTAPLILFSFKNGAKAGFIAGFIYGIFQLIISFHIPPAKNFYIFILVIFLDYLIPYALIGLSPFYVKTIKNKKSALIIGTIFSQILRLLSSVASGAFIWGEYVTKNINIWSYSLIYNSCYMIPETIITTIICYSFINFLLPAKSL